MQVNIVLPVLDEELRIEKGVRELIAYLKKESCIEHVITIVDNGSTDKTEDIANALCAEFPQISYVKIQERGVGVAFRKAVELNKSDIVGYMDIDMSTDLSAVSVMWEQFKNDSDLAMFNASRFAKESALIGRKWYRNFASYFLIFLLKISLKMKASDAICGFKFYRKDIAEKLVKVCSDEPGWFWIIETLIRAEHMGYKIYEHPVKWIYEENSTVDFWAVTINYLKKIALLRSTLKKEKTK